MIRIQQACLRGVILTLLLSATSSSGQMTAGEYQLKAAFLFNFAKFVEWPAERLRPSEPLVIGVVGDDRFGTALDDVVRGRSVGGRRVTIRRLAWNDYFAGCHILFISSSELPYLQKILGDVRGLSILTVADFDGFMHRGGTIELKTADRRIQFSVNLGPARDARLKISSKLLNLAQVVYTPIPNAGTR